jgi:hypothetical protein
MLLGLALTEVFTRAGIKDSDPRITALLQDPAIFKATIDDTVFSEMMGKLMNEEIAQNKLIPAAKSAWTAEIYNGVDDHLKRLLTDEFKFESEAVTEIMKAEKTPKKVEAALKKLHGKLNAELEKARDGKSTADVDKLRQEIVSVREAMGKQETDYKAQLSKRETDFEKERIEMHTQMRLGSYLDRLNVGEGLSADEKYGIMQMRLNGKLSEKKLKLTVQDRKPVLLNEQGTPYYDDQNRLIDFEAFAEQVFAPILTKAPATPPAGGTGGIQIPGNNGSAMKGFNSMLDKHLEEGAGVKMPG